MPLARLLIDSRDRDQNRDPTTNSFVAKFRTIRRVKSITLIDAVFAVNSLGSPNMLDQYVLIKVDKFSSLSSIIDVSAETQISSCFARIPISNYDTAVHPNYVTWRSAGNREFQACFVPLLESISQFRISIQTYNGSPYYTGSESWAPDWSVLLEVEYECTD